MNFSSAKISCKFSSRDEWENNFAKCCCSGLHAYLLFAKNHERILWRNIYIIIAHLRSFLGCLLVTLLDDLPLSTKSCQISWTLNFWRPNGYWCSFRQGVVIFQECLPLSWMICSATQHDPIFHPDFDRLAAVQSAKIAIKHFYNMLIEFDFCPLKRLKVLQKILIVPRLKMFHWR